VIAHHHRPHPGKKPAPVLDQDVGEQSDQHGKGGLGDAAADDRRREVEDPLDDLFDDHLAAGGKELRPSDREADDDDQHEGHDPAGDHAVRDRQRPDREHPVGHRLNPLAFIGESREAGGEGEKKCRGFLDHRHACAGWD